MKAIDNIKAMQLSELEERLQIIHIYRLYELKNDFIGTNNYCDKFLYSDKEPNKYLRFKSNSEIIGDIRAFYKLPEDVISPNKAKEFRTHMMQAIYDERESFNFTYNWLAAIYNHEHGAEIYKLIDPDKQRPQQSLPEEFNTEMAKAMFEETIKEGLCVKDGNLYEWKSTSELFYYYVYKTSTSLELRDHSNRIPWCIYMIAFKRKNGDSKNGAKYINRMKKGEDKAPLNYRKVDIICNRI
jgi:hypothetical protein